MEIRPYRETDEAAVVALWTEAFPDPAAHNVPERDIRRKLETQPELFLVAIEDGTLIGTVMAGFDGHRGWVHRVAVDPPHRRRGVGKALMTQAERALAGLGCTKVNLQVRRSDVGVVEFYENVGYAVEERVSMGKLLAPSAAPGSSVTTGTG